MRDRSPDGLSKESVRVASCPIETLEDEHARDAATAVWSHANAELDPAIQPGERNAAPQASPLLDAERVYREELADHPHNGWSLFGLKQALTAQGKSDPGVDEDLAQSWARSDTWIRSSRF